MTKDEALTNQFIADIEHDFNPDAESTLAAVREIKRLREEQIEPSDSAFIFKEDGELELRIPNGESDSLISIGTQNVGIAVALFDDNPESKAMRDILWEQFSATIDHSDKDAAMQADGEES